MLGLLLAGPFGWYLWTKPAPLDDLGKQARIAEMYASYDDLQGVAVVSATELLARSDAPVLVDVRTAEEQAVSRLPGAIPHVQFEAARASYADRPIVTYCTIGYRSGLFAKDLAAEGFDVLNLEGGILAWTHTGGPLVDDTGSTRRLHVYGKSWDLAAGSYQTTW